MRLSKEEKAFIIAWADLYKYPHTGTIVKNEGGQIKFGNNSWFIFYGKFEGLKPNRIYRIEDLIK